MNEEEKEARQLHVEEERGKDSARDAKRGKVKKKDKASYKKKKIPIIATIILFAFIFGTSGFSMILLRTQMGIEEENAKAIYEILEVDDLVDFVQIKGSDKKGFYLDFVDGADKKLDKLVETLKTRPGCKKIDKELLKKMIKAEVVTQYPLLKGATMNGSSYSGNTVAEKVWNFLISNGYSEIAVAGAMGNIHQESGGFNPALIENGGSGKGIGLCQWSDGRRKQLEEYAKAMGKDWTDADLQLDFLLMELKGGSQYASDGFNGDKASKKKWENSTTTKEAAEAFENGFERASKPMMDNRIHWAQVYYERYRGTFTPNQEEEQEEDAKGFQGTIRIRRVTPNKNIGELRNTGAGEATTTSSTQDSSGVSDYISKQATKGTWSVYAKNLVKNKEQININNRKLRSGNLIELFVMASAFEEIEAEKIKKEDVIDDIKKMISSNDSEAANRIIDKVGMGKISNYIKTNEYSSTQINIKIAEQSSHGDNYTSVRDVGNLLESMYRGKCVSKSASDEMIEILKTQTLTSKIPAGVPNDVETANKTGELNDAENDAAIVYKEKAAYILVVMSNEVTDTRSC